MNIDTQRLMMEQQQHLFEPLDKQRKKRMKAKERERDFRHT